MIARSRYRVSVCYLGFHMLLSVFNTICYTGHSKQQREICPGYQGQSLGLLPARPWTGEHRFKNHEICKAKQTIHAILLGHCSLLQYASVCLTQILGTESCPQASSRSFTPSTLSHTSISCDGP